MALNSILSTTLQLLRDKLIDNSFIAHPLLRAIEENGGLIKVSGGSRVECPVIFGEHSSSITSLVSGFEAVNMAVTDPFQSAKFEYSNFTQPIVLSAVEKAANKGDLAVVNILESKVANVMLSLRKQVNQQIIRGDSAKITDLTTLNGNGTALVAPNTTGFFEGVAAASQGNVVGGTQQGDLQRPELVQPVPGRGWFAWQSPTWTSCSSTPRSTAPTATCPTSCS
jgi:hypothetical protein